MRLSGRLVTLDIWLQTVEGWLGQGRLHVEERIHPAASASGFLSVAWSP